jgi:hypothetical protein
VRFQRLQAHAVAAELLHHEVELGVGVAHGGAVDGNAQAVGPAAGAGRAHVEHGGGRVVAQHEGGAGEAAGHAHDQRLAAAVGIELPHCIGERAVVVEAAVAALEVGEAGDRHGLVGHALAGVAHEGGNGGRHPRDGAHAARALLDVDAGICHLDHSVPFAWVDCAVAPGRPVRIPAQGANAVPRPAAARTSAKCLSCMKNQGAPRVAGVSRPTRFQRQSGSNDTRRSCRARANHPDSTGLARMRAHPCAAAVVELRFS